MRNRFFFIILVALILAAIGINFVHVYFFKSQRLKLIDSQIFESSQSLIESKIFRSSLKSNTLIDQAISEVLAGARVGKVFVVRDKSDKVIYESFNLSFLQTTLPTSPEWVTLVTESQYVRIRNIPIKDKNYTLQVGLVLDPNFLSWEIIDSRVTAYIIGFILALFGASVIITLILLSPLRLLNRHLNEATANLSNLQDVRPLPPPLIMFAREHRAQSDEFSILIKTVQRLIDRINLNYKLTRSWTLQMAHELKTPLSIVRAEVEALRKKNELSEVSAENILEEVHKMTETISQFLEWAELESSHPQKDLHAVKVSSLVKSVISRLEKIEPNRIVFENLNDISVFANPSHVDQLVSNLITNALKYSNRGSMVKIVLQGSILQIIDQGPGVPKEVQERMGEPFNVGHSTDLVKTGNGLGLAWVSTVAKLYSWDFKITNTSTGAHAILNFRETTDSE